ncbi:iron ABC transporter ATP-binding protein [Sinomicrobium soli]|uniref:iron ABC transporter ATP-binding protein n=1 Tax=Sinomicrobium sp. N-1-3-6 TaxID=2219864 RepID=UPI000DCE1D08|nr:ATP-binding cassette domain-containing protein [Sinomicrobium sp. N-1-3-6]RAV27557.1 iron ABC transporter ATP-binding protein [Sinomicrobium sp. N-1-3-6]
MIEARNITKRYGQRSILEEVSIRVPKGRITCLIGSNGAGKSTLLSIISRLLEHDGGTVLLGDRDINDYKNRILARQLSFLKQSNNINMRLTVRELVGFGRFPYSQGRLTAEDQQKIDEALGYLNLEEIQQQYLDELSGGQRQRAFLAMVVAQDTDHILLDEPLNNLDMKHAVYIMKVLRKLTDELGKTIVVVLHDINFASRYSDYIAALKNSKIAYFDKTENIIRPEILREVFDMDFEIVSLNGKNVCNYFG